MTLDNDNYQPLLVEAFNFSRIAGNYVVTGVVAKTDGFGRMFREITVSDASGELTVKCTCFELLGVELTMHTLVFLEAALSQQSGQAEFYCKNLIPIRNGQKLGADLSFLPRALCPIPEAFDGLMIMAERVQQPLLRQFLRDVLLMPDTGLNYLQCPASLNHHHNYPGGLIKHSVSVAWNIFGVLALNHLERDIAVVSGLLHDIGKTRTLTVDMQRTAIGRLVDHSQLTLEICAEPLKVLERCAPGIAYELRHAWTCYSPGARFGYKARTQVAKFLQRVDKMSASRQNWTTPDFEEQSFEWMRSTRAASYALER